jgi:uncharacterized protein YchJ
MTPFILYKKDLCLCGSGKKYMQCCLPYADLTMDNYYSEINKSNYKAAYNVVNSQLTKYLINIKRHTIPLLNQNRDLGCQLLQIDIEAISEYIDTILSLIDKKGVSVNFKSKVNFIASIIKEQPWIERMNSFIVIYYFIIKGDNKKTHEEIVKIDLNEVGDIELIKLILDAKSEELGIGQKISLIDKILASEKDSVVKAKYQFEKAIIFTLNNDKTTGMRIASEVIQQVENFTLEKTYHLYVSAQMFSFYAQLFDEKSYYIKSIELYMKLMDDDSLTEIAKAKNMTAIGYAYYLSDNYENATKYLIDSKKYGYTHLADIYLAFVNIALEEYETAKTILSNIIYGELKEDAFDYLVAYSLYILKSKDKSQIEDIVSYLRKINFENTRYFDMMKMDLIIELQEFSFSDSIDNENVRLKWLDKLNKAITLQPNFFGLGVNINNIIDELNRK